MQTLQDLESTSDIPIFLHELVFLPNFVCGDGRHTFFSSLRERPTSTDKVHSRQKVPSWWSTSGLPRLKKRLHFLCARRYAPNLGCCWKYDFPKKSNPFSFLVASSKSLCICRVEGLWALIKALVLGFCSATFWGSLFFQQRGEPRSNGKKKTSLHILLDYHLKMARTVVICLHGALVVHMTGRFYVLSVVSFS